MTTLTKRTTVYLEDGLHQALRVKAAVSNRSISELINEMIREHLAEDLQIFRDREAGPVMSYEELLQDLQANGKL